MPDEFDRLLADVRLLSSHIQGANAGGPGGSTELELAARALSAHIETLPGRIADAVAAALAQQHRMIESDVRSALAEFAARLEPIAPAQPGPI